MIFLGCPTCGADRVEAVSMALGRCDRSDIMTEVMDVKVVLVGLLTLNNNFQNTCKIEKFNCESYF